MISVLLVMLVVFAFLRSLRATLIPAVAVPVSLIATFGVMYVLGYSLDNLSLMALTIATGFVVDDAIVVLENMARHRAAGLSPLEAALRGAREIGFTVLAISLSLVAVFTPILLMGGMVGRLFREFAVTLSAAIASLAGRVAHDHADDVRHAPRPRDRRGARPALPGERAGLRVDAGPLRDQPLVGAAASPRHARRDTPDRRAERLPVLGGAQGILSLSKTRGGCRAPSRRRRTSRSRRCRPS